MKKAQSSDWLYIIVGIVFFGLFIGQIIIENDISISDVYRKWKTDTESNPKNIVLPYTLRGQDGYIPMKVYGGLDTKLQLDQCDNSIKNCLTRMIDNKEQKKYIQPLIQSIRDKTQNKDDQARIAISLVQHIPYDFDSMFKILNYDERYPYSVLYDQYGKCGEKSKLLALLLKELGYGVAILNYNSIHHQAVGIKCPAEYGISGSEYCFIESTTPKIITDVYGDYFGKKIDKITPDIIMISEGSTFSSVSEEAKDAQELVYIFEFGSNSERGKELTDKYDIKCGFLSADIECFG